MMNARLSEDYGKDYIINLIKGINNSKTFLFLWNNKYSESVNCMKEFNWAISRETEKKLKIMAIELEKIERTKNENEAILFHIGHTTFIPKFYKFENRKLSEIQEEDFNKLIESIKKHLNKSN